MRRMLEEVASIAADLDRPIKLMEVCGTHTVEIFRTGIRGLLPKNISLLSGPGCPVCVTSVRDVDAAIDIARRPGVILGTFGDMMRVPGGRESLLEARSEGADVRVFYSPLDALALAEREPDREVVFFGTGFETTSPLIAGTLEAAESSDRANFSVYAAFKLVPPALAALLDSPDVKVDGFILPGHVSTILGLEPYRFVAEKYQKPSVITGFAAEEIIKGILMILRQLAEGGSMVENAYPSVVRHDGNPRARALLDRYFEPVEAWWRGIGPIPASGLGLRPTYSRFDAARRFEPPISGAAEPRLCSCGDILRGVKIPTECKLFGRGCTPEHPVGPCMVSTEGSCAAYYKYADLEGGASHG